MGDRHQLDEWERDDNRAIIWILVAVLVIAMVALGVLVALDVTAPIDAPPVR